MITEFTLSFAKEIAKLVKRYFDATDDDKKKRLMKKINNAEYNLRLALLDEGIPVDEITYQWDDDFIYVLFLNRGFPQEIWREYMPNTRNQGP